MTTSVYFVFLVSLSVTRQARIVQDKRELYEIIQILLLKSHSRQLKTYQNRKFSFLYPIPHFKMLEFTTLSVQTPAESQESQEFQKSKVPILADE